MLEIVYSGNNWLFMDGNVVVKADERLYRLRDDRPSRTAHYGKVTERILVDVDPAFIDRIRNAKEVGIQFFGEPIHIDSTGKEYIQRFWDDLVIHRPQS